MSWIKGKSSSEKEIDTILRSFFREHMNTIARKLKEEGFISLSGNEENEDVESWYIDGAAEQVSLIEAQESLLQDYCRTIMLQDKCLEHLGQLLIAISIKLRSLEPEENKEISPYIYAMF